MLKAVVFDEFASQCPYFYSYEKEHINNYYNCKHPEQEEIEKSENGDEVGKCCCYSCPLGREASKEDMIRNSLPNTEYIN